MQLTELTDAVLEATREDPGSFIGKIIDIANVSEKYASHLNLNLAEKFGVNAQDLSKQVVEDIIRKNAWQRGIATVCLDKSYLHRYGEELLNELTRNYICILK